MTSPRRKWKVGMLRMREGELLTDVLDWADLCIFREEEQKRRKDRQVWLDLWGFM